MAMSHVLSGLIDRRSKLAGELAYHQARAVALTYVLQNLDATLRLFKDAPPPETIRTRRYYIRDCLFRHGELPRLTLNLLRQSPTPMSVARIVSLLLTNKGIDTTERKIIEKVIERVTEFLKYKAKQGVVERLGKGCTARWQIAPPRLD